MARILIVDDHPSNRAYLVTLLGYHAHQLFEAGDGLEALRLAASIRPDLVITDILMPTMDGYEFVRRLRADPAIAGTAVMFFTAHYRHHEAEALAKSVGVDQILIKPCEPEVILAAVQQALGAGRPFIAPAAPGFDEEHLRVVADKLAQTVDDLKTTNQRLAVLAELNLLLASEPDPEKLLRNLCESARDLIGAKNAVLVVGSNRRNQEVLIFTSGMDEAAIAKLGPATLDTGLGGRALSERKAFRAVINPEGTDDLGLPPHFPLPRSLVLAPIVSVARAYGWICLTDKVGAIEFNAEDERILEILAALGGRIYENGSLYADVQRHASVLIAEIERRKEMEKALVESEQRFRQMAESIRDAFFLMEARTRRILYISPAYDEIWGRPRRALYQNSRAWFEEVHPEDRDRVAEMYDKGVAAGRFDFEHRIVRPDGSVRWVYVRGFPVLNGSNPPNRVAGVAQDITDSKNADLKIRRLNRVYSVLSGINALIVRVKYRPELFNEACRIAVDDAGFCLAWIALLDPAETTLSVAAVAGTDPALLAAIQALFPGGSSPLVNSTAEWAVREKKPFISNDSQNDSRVKTSKQQVAFGIRAFAMFPLLVSGTMVGVLTLATSEIDFFRDDEMRLLTELAGDIAFAIDHLDKQERLQYVAYYDVLTGLANRTLFMERLGSFMRSAADNKQTLAVGLLDINRFKNINDGLGRTAGDSLLKQMAEWLLSTTADAALVARVGPDQFGVVLPRVRPGEDVGRWLEQKRQQCLDHPFRLNDAAFRVAFTGGVALFPNDGADAEALFKNAEAALKEAKVRGDHVLSYAPRMTEAVAGELTLENQLRHALENGEFVLHYQAKVDLTTHAPKGAEALIRWNDPRNGLIPPARFIPILEQTGLIHEVGMWAMRRAMQDYLAWRATDGKGLRVAVNVSPPQLRDPGFVDRIKEILAMDPHAAEGLELELTESLIMQDVERCIVTLRAVRELGVTIAVDDFGTGFSSLSYLAKLPLDKLKIDRSFVTNMTSAPEGLALVSTIITLAHSMKLKVVAEGVETEEQSRLLHLLGCDEVQGFLFSKPVPAHDFVRQFVVGRPA